MAATAEAGTGSNEPTYGETVGALRSYITGPGTMQAAASTVKLTITHSNLKQRIMELRFDRHESIQSVKDTLYTYNGTSPGMMELRLLRGGTLVRRHGMFPAYRAVIKYSCSSTI